MKSYNLFARNIYKLYIKLLPLFICCFFNGCGEAKQNRQFLSTENAFVVSENAIDINHASAEELGKLPGIGTNLAQGIVEHRSKFGNFRKTEHLLMIEGISDKRYRELKHLIKTE